MHFGAYLQESKRIAIEEKEILELLAAKEELSPIELRAAKNSLQVLIENAIGKAKRILKHYNCPVVPQRSRDAISFLYEVGAIDDEMYRSLHSAIGFRNSMIHEYMRFDEAVLYKILEAKRYLDLYDFLVDPVEYNAVVIKRIENFIL